MEIPKSHVYSLETMCSYTLSVLHTDGSYTDSDKAPPM